MKLYYFSEFPHHEYPDAEGDKFPSLRLAFPNRFFDRAKASSNYQRYLTEYELADEVGFDGLMINEHHSTPSCVNVGANMTAAVLARTTKRAKLLLLGNILPIEDNPVRMAEQIAMADLISGGRVLSGFVRGVGVEQWWANSNPVHNRERFEECHDLILKCWTEPGPFRWEGPSLPLPAREPVVPAAAAAASADLGAGHGESGDGRVGGAPRLHLRARSWCRSTSRASSSTTTARARRKSAARSRRTISAS
jgi:alkanesulfonate monooxygenase SsuD/methylene tetrahydromethanopterin reductase-like flavin-dependent oxidoreductase (luciferase family)